MSVRKRTWKTSKGVEKEAWVVDYFDKVEGGKRHLKSLGNKKDAVDSAATARTEVRAGMHTADSQSVTVSEAGRLWITTGEKNRLERSTLTMYRQQLSLHIAPYLGNVKLSQAQRPHGARIRGQVSPRWTHGGDGTESARLTFVIDL